MVSTAAAAMLGGVSMFLQVLFDEFCAWCAERQIAAGTALGSTQAAAAAAAAASEQARRERAALVIQSHCVHGRRNKQVRAVFP